MPSTIRYVSKALLDLNSTLCLVDSSNSLRVVQSLTPGVDVNFVLDSLVLLRTGVAKNWYPFSSVSFCLKKI